MINRLLTLLLACALILPCGGCEKRTEFPLSGSASLSLEDALLPESADAGEEYIDSLIFFGESTTYHLKSRGVLRGGNETDQVWAPESGTVNLDYTTKDIKILYPATKEKMTVAEAAAISKPKYIVLTFGLNGAVSKIKLGKETFKDIYLSLIDSVRSASESTRIILQSAFPIASNMNTDSYGVSAAELNSYIDTINGWTHELAAEEGLRYLATYEILKDGEGFLFYELQAGDGHHLSTEAYEKILHYIRTHPYTEEVTQ